MAVEGVLKCLVKLDIELLLTCQPERGLVRQIFLEDNRSSQQGTGLKYLSDIIWGDVFDIL